MTREEALKLRAAMTEGATSLDDNSVASGELANITFSVIKPKITFA